ncbi:MAG: GNAT family N-acetyltransferase, partial [Paracoccaceae bacterium]|nr:GNAT family N-acetyltransferase [Paracoccaceae bacterium]
MMPDAETLYEVVEQTWPAAREIPCGPLLLREGKGGGKRVSAATAVHPNWTGDDITDAEDGMEKLGQSSLFMLREGESRLDDALANRGYSVIDPVNMYCIPVSDLAKNVPPRVSTFAVWSPLAIGYDIWAEGGICAGRWSVMDRVKGPKTSILGRWNDSPAGIAFVAIHDGIAMVHALEILPDQRRQGMAEKMMAAASIWAQKNGASHMSVICTAANDAANNLYFKLGMKHIGG